MRKKSSKKKMVLAGFLAKYGESLPRESTTDVTRRDAATQNNRKTVAVKWWPNLDSRGVVLSKARAASREIGINSNEVDTMRR